MSLSKDDIEKITWTRAPHLMLYYFLVIITEFIQNTLQTIVQQSRISIPILVGSTLFIYVLEYPPATFVSIASIIRDEGSFALYWIILGVLSSIGLGSGLHTFVLFLGPHIMRIANIAMLHGSTDFSGKIHSYFTWPENGWDIAALAQAFSPNYAEDAWDLHSSRILPNSTVLNSCLHSPENEQNLTLDLQCQNMIADDSLINQEVSFFAIVVKVWWACFLWGFGTSLGELPPYFIALAAARAGTALDELNEIAQLEKTMEEEYEEEHAVTKKGKRSTQKEELSGKRSKSGSKRSSSTTNISSSPTTASTVSTSSSSSSTVHHHTSIVDRAKVWVFECVKQYGFWAILAAASIPNPLFDLAGLTCGTFGVSFWTFFGATFIGKAIVKVSIQAFFIIAITKYGPLLFGLLRTFLPGALGNMITNFEKNFEKSQHCVCVQETSFTDCEVCCIRDFRSKGSDQECISLCSLAGTPAAHTCTSSGGSSIISDIWGYFLTVMILWFVGTLIQSLVSEYLVRQILSTQGSSGNSSNENTTVESLSTKSSSSSSRNRRKSFSTTTTTPNPTTEDEEELVVMAVNPQPTPTKRTNKNNAGSSVTKEIPRKRRSTRNH